MQAKNSNLNFLKDWMTFILNFLHRNNENNALYETMLTRVMKYYDEKKKKEMNFMLMELRSVVSTSSEKIQSALDDSLKKEFNMTFKDITPISKKNQSLNEKQEVEAAFIKDWCLTLLEFIYSKYSEQASFGEMHKAVFGEETKQKYLNELSPSIYLKGLRMAFNDTNEMAMDAPPAIQEEVNKILRDKFGKDLMTYSKKIQKKITQIRQVGKISNVDEYSLIMSYIDTIYNEESKREELDILNSLLLSWDNGMTKK